MNIRKVIEAKGSSSILTIPSSATLSEFARLACEKNIGALLVADKKKKMLGIVTERDILRQCNARADFDKVTVADVMTKNLISVGPDDDINIAMDLMIAKKVRHLPVVSDKGIEGLITIRDLILAMRKADEEDVKYLVEYLQTQIDSPNPG